MGNGMVCTCVHTLLNIQAPTVQCTYIIGHSGTDCTVYIHYWTFRHRLNSVHTLLNTSLRTRLCLEIYKKNQSKVRILRW